MNPHPATKVARRDLLLLGAGALVFAVISVRLELFERIQALTRGQERFQIDELPGVLLFVACGLAWYAWRRVREARVELALRQEAEERLREALAENRDLALAAVRMQEDERRGLARELHDELGQHLLAARLDAAALRDIDDPSSPGAEVVRSLDRVDGVVHDLVRRLRPPGLDDLGLPAALEAYIDAWRRRLPAVDFQLRLHADLGTFDEAINITLYRLVQEGLTNVAKHAEAALVEVSLCRTSGPAAEVMLTVRDNGRGSARAGRTGGLGLIGMRERVQALAGRLEIATGVGRGFTIIARIPLPSPVPA